MTVTVRYFAKLKEDAGTSQESFETNASTIAVLWKEASALHGFTLDSSLVKAAQGDEFCPWDSPLVPGLTVAFMPPVAGG